MSGRVGPERSFSELPLGLMVKYPGPIDCRESLVGLRGGLRGREAVTGDMRRGLGRSSARSLFARASAAAMSIEMLLPDREWWSWIIWAGVGVGAWAGVCGRLLWMMKWPLELRDSVGRGA